MNKIRPDDDRDLVSFLQQYRPIPPPAPASSEQDLMDIIAKEESNKKTWKLKPIITIASAAVAGSILSWIGFNRSLTPSYTNAQLETFMVNSWDRTVGENSSSSFYDWLALNDRDSNNNDSSSE